MAEAPWWVLYGGRRHDLIKFGGARRVLFLVDRSNLGEQAEKEFQSFRTPDDNRKFTELYTVQRLSSNTIGASSKVVISTIQRLYSVLKGEPELDPEAEAHTDVDDARVFRRAFDWPDSDAGESHLRILQSERRHGVSARAGGGRRRELRLRGVPDSKFTLKQRRMSRADLDDFVACYNPENRNRRKPTWSEKNPGGRWRPFA